MPNTYRYKAFLSYSHTDGQSALWLQRALETYRVPRKVCHDTGCSEQIGEIFRDEDELGVATDLSESIRDALAKSEYLIVLCSPEAGRSEWVNREVLEFQNLGRENNVFCVQVDGLIGDQECLPPLLRDRGEHAPLMVDPRPNAERKRVARMRIAAALQGIDFSLLLDRETHRRHKRMMGFVATIMLALVLTSALAVIAFDARNTAIVERERAEGQALIAKQTLDFLVDVFQVSDPSDTRGNSVTARELLDGASERIGDGLENDPDARIMLMNTIATVYTNLGLYDASIELFEQSLAAHEITGSTQSIEAAETFSDLGIAHHHLGDYERAISLHRRALEIRSRIDPESALVADSFDNIGTARFFQDDYEGARDVLLRALKIRQAVFSEVNSEIATSFNNLGAASIELGDFDAAVEYQQQAYDAFSALLGPTHQKTLIVLNNLATNMRDMGYHDQAHPLFQRLLENLRSIHTPPHPDLANAYNNYSIYLIQTDRPDEALKHVTEARKQWSETLGEEHHRTLTASSLTGLAYYHQGNLAEAEKILTKTIATQEAVGAPKSTIAPPILHLALVKYALGEFEEGIELSRRARLLASEAWPTHEAKQANYRAFIARGLTYIGDYEEAGAIFNEAYPLILTSYKEESYAAQRIRRWMDELTAKAQSPTL